jgi:hypothetical protein
MTNSYRTMLTELLEWAERTSSHYYKQADVIVRARALLAQPVAEGPTIPSSTLHRQELTPSEVTLLNTFWRSR